MVYKMLSVMNIHTCTVYKCIIESTLRLNSFATYIRFIHTKIYSLESKLLTTLSLINKLTKEEILIS